VSGTGSGSGMIMGAGNVPSAGSGGVGVGISGPTTGGSTSPTAGAVVSGVSGHSSTPSNVSSVVSAPGVSVLNPQAFQDDSGEPPHLRAVKANLRKELLLLFTQHKVCARNTQHTTHTFSHSILSLLFSYNTPTQI
jgi:hypothetical protein